MMCLPVLPGQLESLPPQTDPLRLRPTGLSHTPLWGGGARVMGRWEVFRG